MEVWYTATEKFDPNNSAEWDKYVQWAQLPQLKEVISLDTSLCPSVFRELIAKDWNHNIQQHYRVSYFKDLDYVMERIKEQKDAVNVLAVVFEPASDPTKLFNDDGFVFYGYDLLDEGSAISALTNCGGFDQAFNSSDISDVGLLEDYLFARKVQRRLRQNYPHEPHAACDLWALWRLENLSNWK